jgi:hypothetical protein
MTNQYNYKACTTSLIKGSLAILTLLLFTNTSAIGQCIEGDCINGTGIMVFNSGNKYKGEFVDGKRQGEGTFVWVSGAKYRGQWLNDQMHGEGTYVYPDRRVYRGAFVDGKKNGKGELTTEDGKVLERGKWVNDEFVDPAAIRYSYINIGSSLLSNFAPDIPVVGEATCINPTQISFDFGITPFLTVGAFVNYSSISVRPSSEVADFNYSYITPGGRVTAVLNVFSSDRVIPYVGGQLGYSIASGGPSNTALGMAESELNYMVYAGIRSFFTDHIGLFAEGGIGQSNVNVGLSYRL